MIHVGETKKEEEMGHSLLPSDLLYDIRALKSLWRASRLHDKLHKLRIQRMRFVTHDEVSWGRNLKRKSFYIWSIRKYMITSQRRAPFQFNIESRIEILSSALYIVKMLLNKLDVPISWSIITLAGDLDQKCLTVTPILSKHCKDISFAVSGMSVSY